MAGIHLLKLDLFSKRIELRIKKKVTHKTSCGILTTYIFFTLVIVYILY